MAIQQPFPALVPNVDWPLPVGGHHASLGTTKSRALLGRLAVSLVGMIGKVALDSRRYQFKKRSQASPATANERSFHSKTFPSKTVAKVYPGQQYFSHKREIFDGGTDFDIVTPILMGA